MIDGEGLRGTTTIAATLNASEIGRGSEHGTTCHHAPCLAASLHVDSPPVGGHHLPHARGHDPGHARGQPPHRARPLHRPQGNRHIVCRSDMNPTPQMPSWDITANEETASLRAVAAAAGAGVGAETGGEPTGKTAMTGEAADTTDPLEMGTDGGKRATILSLPVGIGQSRLARQTRRDLAHLIHHPARRMYGEVLLLLLKLNQHRKARYCPALIQPSSLHCRGRRRLHRCACGRLRHCWWWQRQT